MLSVGDRTGRVPDLGLPPVRQRTVKGSASSCGFGSVADRGFPPLHRLVSADRPVYRADMRWLLLGLTGLAAGLAALVAYNTRFERRHGCNCLDSCWCRSRLGRHARWWWPAKHQAPTATR
ncbi:hypothetical protein Airi01_026470 [Actinoallomurus iriomotensis]|uniref:Uncharacterized protein n=1 Tax=Actinoallomurus iriomotensis TaxID=478107 RepID=A0A9W6RI98_9ACTN|nr:hypothetical protein Airi01_026470 [Actinoallomurus iriomotensis]